MISFMGESEKRVLVCIRRGVGEAVKPSPPQKKMRRGYTKLTCSGGLFKSHKNLLI